MFGKIPYFLSCNACLTASTPLHCLQVFCKDHNQSFSWSLPRDVFSNFTRLLWAHLLYTRTETKYIFLYRLEETSFELAGDAFFSNIHRLWADFNGWKPVLIDKEEDSQDSPPASTPISQGPKKLPKLLRSRAFGMKIENVPVVAFKKLLEEWLLHKLCRWLHEKLLTEVVQFTINFFNN